MNRSQMLSPLPPACLSLFLSIFLSLSLTSTTHLLHIPSLGFWMEDHEGSPHQPLSFALGNGTANQQSSGSPLTGITGAILAECEEEESPVLLLNSSSTAWSVVSAHHPHHDYVEGQHRCRMQRQPWHLSSPDPYLVPSLYLTLLPTWMGQWAREGVGLYESLSRV